MQIKILGAGCCKNCERLAENTRLALLELNLKEEVIKVTNSAEIANSGILSVPALVIDGKALSYGRVPLVEEIKKMITGAKKDD